MADAFRQIPYGIYVLTARQGSDLHALIVSWVSQVSYSPPLLLVALRNNRRALPALQASGRFSLSLLSRGQKDLVRRLKEPRPASSSSIYDDFAPDQPPVLKDCQASWQCTLISHVEAGDHTLCIGEVRSAAAKTEGEPLSTMEYGKTYIGQS